METYKLSNLDINQSIILDRLLHNPKIVKRNNFSIEIVDNDLLIHFKKPKKKITPTITKAHHTPKLLSVEERYRNLRESQRRYYQTKKSAIAEFKRLSKITI